MSTTLLDLASRVFLLLASFRRKAARGAPLAGDQLHAEATQLFGELDQTAQREPAVAEAWNSARTVLVYLVDEVMTGTEWEHRAWWDDNVLESSVLNNPQKMRGILFFDELEKAKRMYREASGPKSECMGHLLTVLYYCLRFGFCGKFVGQTRELECQTRKILELLPASRPRSGIEPRAQPVHPRSAGAGVNPALFEQAYSHTVEVPPSYHNVMRLGTILAVIAGLAILFVGFRNVLWNELLDGLAATAEQVGNFFETRD